MRCFGCHLPIVAMGFTLSVLNSEGRRVDEGFCTDCTARLYAAIDDHARTHRYEYMFESRAPAPEAHASRGGPVIEQE